MADWTKPTVASTYANYTTELKGLLTDLALACDPALVTLTSPLTNTVRWNSASSRWEKYNGTSWAVLASTYAINAATASAWATGRTLALTGDATGTSAAFTGAANVSFAVTLATVNSNVGSFGSVSAVPVITVNAKGLITAVGTAALGTIATQNAATVAITGGSIAGTDITLKQSTTAAPTGEGTIEWDTDSDKLRVGTGAATKTMVDTDSTETLTNKTLGTGSSWAGTAVPVANGGTGSTTAAAARTALGVGTMGTQNATAVAITGGTIAGTTLTLKQSTTAAPTAEGAIEWDTDSDKLVLGTATGTKTMVDTDSVQTLTNKTIDGASNTFANLPTSALTVTSLTVNGVEIALGASGTITAACPTALTFKTDGTGAAGNTTYTGATARSISYNSVGAPSVGGTNATGTWGISITGNAATVTNGVYTTGDQTIAGVKTWSAQQVWGGSAAHAFTNVVGSYTGFFTLGGRGIRKVTTGHAIEFINNANTIVTHTLGDNGDFTAAGNVTAYSDERLKKDWNTGYSYGSFLQSLSWVQAGSYTRTDTGERQVGVSAQALRLVMPEAVLEDKDGMLSVAYGNAALVACVALAREVTSLRERLAALEAK